jgi:hypothetical protein
MYWHFRDLSEIESNYIDNILGNACAGTRYFAERPLWVQGVVCPRFAFLYLHLLAET